jgi:4-aminobutyrate aminotransferase-like enzyme
LSDIGSTSQIFPLAPRLISPDASSRPDRAKRLSLGETAAALIATSGEQAFLFLAPPLVISETELDRVFDALHHGLTAADQE